MAVQHRPKQKASLPLSSFLTLGTFLNLSASAYNRDNDLLQIFKRCPLFARRCVGIQGRQCEHDRVPITPHLHPTEGNGWEVRKQIDEEVSVLLRDA